MTKKKEVMTEEAISSLIAYFSNENIKKGKALSLLIPLVQTEELVELLAELYDLRKLKELKK